MARYKAPESTAQGVDDDPITMVKALRNYRVMASMWNPPHPAAPLMWRKARSLEWRGPHAKATIERHVTAMVAYIDELGLTDHFTTYLENGGIGPVQSRPPMTVEIEAQQESLRAWPPARWDRWTPGDHI
jgi:hypothetical protein